MTERSVPDQLLDSATRFAGSAMRAHLERDGRVFLLHAATALEQLLKCHLASINGSLIAAPNDFDSLLHFAGHRDRRRTTPTRLRTIGAQEAIKRVGQLLPAIENLGGQLQLLIEVRNGVVHAGHLQRDPDVLVPFLRACDHLLEQTPDAQRDAFWGDSIDFVDAKLSESATAANVRATEAIAAARQSFEKRFGSIDSALRATMIASVEETYSPEKYEQTLYTCPACGHEALVFGSYDVAWEPDWDYSDGEVWMAGAYPTVHFAPGGLACRVCGLELDGEDELEAAGLPSTWELGSEEVDPSDFVDRDEDFD